MSAKEVFLEKKGSLGLITLNRPEALNALTLNMVREIYPKLKLWAEDDEILAVAVIAVGDKAFCAGGDIRALYEWGKDGDERATGFYYEEYLLNQIIKSFPKPYISFVNGIVMGGGVGLSVHGSHRIAGENFSFAMPETGIGLFPDVGGSYFLSRLNNNAGMYLALTGSRLKAADSIYLGIAEYFIESKNYEEIINKLVKGESPEEVLKEYNSEPGISDFQNISEEIEQLFSGNELEEIFIKLENKNSELSQKLYKTILTKSPTSLKISFKQIIDGKKNDFEDCMRMEFRMVSRVMSDHDFYEGVRALIIDKDNNPNWNPDDISKINEEDVERFFTNLDDKELNFNKG